MKISYNWLKEHVALELSVQDLAGHLLRLGFEATDVERLGPAFTGVVVGRVLSKDKHPNADKLAVCVVDDGSQRWSVVCAAPNVAAGQTIAFARVGAMLPGELKIGKAKLRGVESQGMICSREELGLSKNGDGIWVLDGAPALGTDVTALAGPADDVFELEVTPNRPDALSHRGLARELAAYFKLPLKPLVFKLAETSPAREPVSVQDAAACPYYCARLIAGVTVGPSPDWLRQRLGSIGLRPINAVADITNFVLHDCGQPLHAFDADRLAGGRIVVRRSKAGETLRALDHRRYDIPEGLLVIADAERPVALAGVMGGEESAVTEKTTRVLLESAYFSPAEIRRSSRETRLRSDSSYRYERGCDPAAPPEASRRAAALIVELIGGEAGPAAAAGLARAVRKPIACSLARLNGILGTEDKDAIAEREAVDILTRLAAELKSAGNELAFTPPSWRYDLETPHDLAEELARFAGYDRIPYRRSPSAAPAARVTPGELASRRLRQRLSACGLDEIYSYDLVSERLTADARLDASLAPRVANPLSEDWALLRLSLLPGLLRAVRLNLNHGAESVRLHELGKTYRLRGAELEETWRCAGVLLGPTLEARWQPARSPRADFHDAKGAVEAAFEGIADPRWVPLRDEAAGHTPSDPAFHPVNALRLLSDGRPVATAGWLHPRVARAFELEREGAAVFDLDLEWFAGQERPRPRLRAYSPFTPMRRDLALVVAEHVSYGRLEAAARGAAGPELRGVELFDVYRGPGIPEGRKSLAVRLTLGRMDRTLTDAEAAKIVAAVVAALRRELGVELRS